MAVNRFEIAPGFWIMQSPKNRCPKAYQQFFRDGFAGKSEPPAQGRERDSFSVGYGWTKQWSEDLTSWDRRSWWRKGVELRRKYDAGEIWVNAAGVLGIGPRAESEVA